MCVVVVVGNQVIQLNQLDILNFTCMRNNPNRQHRSGQKLRDIKEGTEEVAFFLGSQLYKVGQQRTRTHLENKGKWNTGYKEVGLSMQQYVLGRT